MANITITDNRDEVLQKLRERIDAALEAVGNQCVSHAKQNITAASRVDTGAMRNSISHIVSDDVCHVGTNIEYAIYNEMGTGIYIEGGRVTPWAYEDAHGVTHWTRGMPGIHFLRNAAADHTDEYKAIIENELKKL